MGRRQWHRERQFGVSVGLVLLAVAAWFLWRGRSPLVVGVPAGVGALLVLLGVAWPRALVHVNRGWMALAEALSWVSTRVLLGLLFYLVLSPLGAWRRWRGADPLDRRAPVGRQSFWKPYSARQADPRHYEKMF
jgi:thiol:disulfide interchange protein